MPEPELRKFIWAIGSWASPQDLADKLAEIDLQQAQQEYREFMVKCIKAMGHVAECIKAIRQDATSIDERITE